MRKTLLALALLLVSSLLAALPSMEAMAQEHRVSGKVTGTDGNPLPGITIQVKGTSTGTATDANGQYELTAPENTTFIFRGVGFMEQSIDIGSRSHVNVTLRASTAQLNELVVTALGIQREARTIGYSVSSVDSKALNVAKPVTVAQGLVGRVAGLQISTLNNGVSPGVRIQLRGERHIYADNQPLIVVDGMEVRPDYLLTLNPEDVADVSVLKGASAAALYGAEASNGVLIVTTKKGTIGGKPVVRFSSEVTFERFSYFPKLQDQFSGYGGESGNFFFGPAINPYTGFPNYIPFENQSYGPEYDGNPANGYIGGPNDSGQVYKTPFRGGSPDYRYSFFQTGVSTQNEFSYSGGDAKNSYFLSAQDVNRQDPIPKDAYRRDNIRFNGKKTYGVFSAQWNFAYSHEYSNTVGNGFTQGGAWPLYWQVLNTQASVPLNKLKDVDNPKSFANASNWYNAYYENPWWTIDHSRNMNQTDNVQGGLDLNLRPATWLNLLYRVSGQVSINVLKNHTDPVQFSAYSQTDPWQAGNYQSGGNNAGRLEDQNYYFRRLQQDIMATFTKKIGDLDGTLILGNTIWDHNSNVQYDASNAIFLTGVNNISYIQGIPTASQSSSDERRVGLYGDLTLIYHNDLTLHGNLRRDWSSLLAKQHNHYDVWDIDAAWVFTDAIASLKNSNVLTYGKVRAAYSSTGQITANPYTILPSFGVARGYPYGGLAALSVSGTYNNPNLVPEKTVEKEIGLEMGFWKDRVNVDLTYYTDDNSNQEYPVNLSPSTGYSNAYINAAAVRTWGYEFDVKVTPVLRTNSGFSWNVGANLAINDSKVLSLIGGVKEFAMPGGAANYAIVNQPFPVMKVRDLLRDPQGNVVVNSNGYPQKDNSPTGLKIVGRTTPKYILGLNTMFAFKNLSLTIVGDYRGGYIFYSNAGQSLDFTGASVHTTQNGRQNFIFPGSVIDEGNGKYVPNTNLYAQDGGIGFWVSSDYRGAGTTYVMNAAAWKVRSATLTYDFGEFVHNKLKFVQNASFSIIGNNLLMFVPKENVWGDPEFNYANSNSLGYTTFYQLPPTRSFSGMLSVTF